MCEKEANSNYKRDYYVGYCLSLVFLQTRFLEFGSVAVIRYMEGKVATLLDLLDKFHINHWTLHEFLSRLYTRILAT